MNRLKRMCEAWGVPGYEKPIRDLIAAEIDGLFDTVETDYLGNLIAHKSGEGPVVALAGHMDEIGFLVSHIEEDSGFLRLQRLGGFDPVTLVAQRVEVHTAGGDLVGCIGRKPIHILSEEERKKPVQIEDLFVDLGMAKDTVTQRVAVGDPVTMKQAFLSYGDVVSGKALDDRLGVYVAIEAVRRASRIGCDLYFVATSQEEVGVRGAQVAGFRVRPDLAVALDVCIAADMPGVPANKQLTQLGKGAAISIKDAGSISHPGLVRAFRRLAETREIPFQMTLAERGGTDARALQGAAAGSAAITLSIPTRYVHSVVETVHRDDIESAVNLLTAFLETASEIHLEA